MPIESPTFDSFELARSRRSIDGEVSIARLPRLADFLTTLEGVLRYRLEGVIDDQGRAGADLQLTGRLPLICHRCNAPLDFELDRTTRFIFVAGESELNALPIEDDEIDAVIGSRAMDIHQWIEDEAILSLPLVPRHDGCSAPVVPIGDERPGAKNPFTELAALRLVKGAK